MLWLCRKAFFGKIPFPVIHIDTGYKFKQMYKFRDEIAREWGLDLLVARNEEALNEELDVLISTYTLLDRVQHFHWGEDCVLEWYRKLDGKIGELIFDTGFLDNKQSKLIVISDHGFCSFGEAEIQTLPLKSEWGELKGDHHENALLITVNLDRRIERPQDVFFALMEQFGRQ